MTTMGQKRLIRILNDLIELVRKDQLATLILTAKIKERTYPTSQTVYDTTLNATLNNTEEYNI